MSRPSISVRNCGRAFIFASILRQSYSVAQYRASAWVVASCTPWDASVTASRSGHLVALMRRRSSVNSVSGTFTRNGRMAVLSVAVVGVMVSFLLEVDFPVLGVHLY